MGTAWIVITANHLNDYSAGAKVNALRTAALAGGQADPFLTVMPDVVARVRAQIGSNKTNQLSATANSVSPDLKTHTCWLIIEAMQSRLPGLKLTDEEKNMVKKAEDYLARVAKGDFLVLAPTDPLGTSPLEMGASAEVVSSTTRISTRETLDGL